MDSYKFKHRYKNKDHNVEVTEEAWTDVDCLDGNHDDAISVAEWKFDNGILEISEDAFQREYYLITSEDVRTFRSR